MFPSNAEERLNDIALHSVSVTFSRECEVTSDKGDTSCGVFTIVQFSETDREVVRIFLNLIEDLFFGVLEDFSNRRVRAKILDLAEMFRETRLEINDIVGLWGEVFLIGRAKNQDRAVSCWSQNRYARFDFVSDSYSVEVKSTISSVRSHRFSLDQLRPSSNSNVYIASLQLVENLNGATISEIVERTCEIITDPAIRRELVSQCLRKGGSDVFRSDLRLSPLEKECAVLIFRAEDIPVPLVEPGDPIDKVKFNVDLTSTTPLSEAEAISVLTFE